MGYRELAFAAVGETPDERTAIARLSRLLPLAPDGETWLGDDTAVLGATGAARLLLATDCLVEGVHFVLGRSSLADVGWKSVAVNLSDVAAMGGRPIAAVVSVAGIGADRIEHLYEGILEASTRYRCPIVGGDLSSGAELVVSLAVLGIAGPTGPVLRSGAKPGDALFVTGPLGASAAGMRLLSEDLLNEDLPHEHPLGADRPSAGSLGRAHRRPEARIDEGAVAAQAGATAMIDVSDGLGIDLDRLAVASGVGVELDDVPVAEGATLEEAIGGGEDYELVLASGEPEALIAAFAGAGLRAPLPIGRCVADRSIRTLGGEPLPRSGYVHLLDHGDTDRSGTFKSAGGTSGRS